MASSNKAGKIDHAETSTSQSAHRRLASSLLLLPCNKPKLVANFPNFKAAADQCLIDLDMWLEQELTKPLFINESGVNTKETFLKNKNGEYIIKSKDASEGVVSLLWHSSPWSGTV